jgi:hypothetical protein
VKIARLLFKPRWQDKDAQVRRQAIADGDDPVMLAALPDLACADPDAGVRLAALRRADDFELWRSRSQADDDAQVRVQARSAYLDALCGSADRPPAMPQRVADLEQLAAREIEHLARHAKAAELRAAAMNRVARIATLVECAVSDPDTQLRLAALARIDDAAALQRIAERTRKTDKAVNQMARERLQQARIAAGDGAAVAARAQELCERMDALMRHPDAAVDARADEIDALWRALPATIPDALRAHYDGSLRLVRGLREAALNRPVAAVEAPVAAPAPPELPEPNALADSAAVAAESSAETIAAKSFRQERSAIKRLLEVLEQALDKGTALDAHRAQSELRELLASAPAEAMTPQLRLRHEPLQSRYAEMKRWQQWSNRQRRNDLCADIETLARSGTHPDALATRLREAREEWRRLDAAEGLADTDAAATAMARRFHALCHRAERTARPYFAARKQLRHAHTEQTQHVLEQLQALPDEGADWPTLSKLRGLARAALHGLDEVDPRQRTELAQQLKQGLARLAALSCAVEDAGSHSRRKLIAQAQALVERGPTSSAAREARQLQQQWQALAKGPPRSDQALWQEFRAACNAVFERLDADRRERTERQAQARAEAEAVLGQLESLAAEHTLAAEAVRSRLRELDAQWHALSVEDRDLLKRQQQAHASIAAGLAQAAQRQRQARFVDALEKFARLRLAETGNAVDEPEWDGSGKNAFDDALRARWAERADRSSTIDDTSVRELAVRLEYLAGIESPSADRQLRMNHQVQRLSSRLRDAGASSNPERELETLMLAWFGQPAVDLELESRFVNAAQVAIQALR